MPAIRAQLRRLTPHGPPPVSINPEETTACGAAIQAAILTGLHCDATVWDVTPFALVLAEPDGRRRTLLEANVSIPVRATAIVEADATGRCDLALVQVPGHGSGERPIGRFAVRGEEPGPVRLAFDVDDDGLVAVSVCDRVTGAERPVAFHEATRVDPAGAARGPSTGPSDHGPLTTMDDRISDVQLALARELGEAGDREPRARRPARPRSAKGGQSRRITRTLTSQ
jgi:molecular chaperone DnaK (HSP70)